LLAALVTLSANVKHLNLVMVARLLAQLRAKLAVSIAARQPYVANGLQQLLVGGTAA
jgi:hypothetical protein